MATRDQVIDQMRAAGMDDLPPEHPRFSAGGIVRFGRKKKCYYRFFEHRTRDGRYYYTGFFGKFGEIPTTNVQSDWTGVEQEERDRLRREQAVADEARKKRALAQSRFAANRARSQWEAARSAKPESVATYLERKSVAHTKGLRYAADGTLFVPMIRYDVTEAQEKAADYAGPRRLVGLQKIAPDGEKRFNKGMAKEGAACRLGHAPASGEPILLTEGLATALSITMAIAEKHPVFVAFDAGNLLAVAKCLRKLHPKSPLLICADDDAYLEASMNKMLRENHGIEELLRAPTTYQAVAARGGAALVSVDWTQDADGVPGLVGGVRIGDRLLTFSRENAGRKYAHRAAAEVGDAAVVYPVFAERYLAPTPDTAKLTDFNDVHVREGLDAVRRQLASELERIEFSIAVRRAVKDEFARAKKDSKARAPGGSGGSDPGKPANDFDWRRLFERFTLIYPTDTLWDATLREIVKLTPVKLMFGERVMKFWLESPERRTVNLDQLVFEPGTEVPANSINLFRGMPMKPSAQGGSCTKLIALLQYLCGEAVQEQTPVTDWVLKWLAYPLQHPGAKMQTAIVMHGHEGTGKNIFFGAVREIFGEYGTLITQTELEDRFNGWLSRRLFLIANEVISRQELRHHVGRLKNMITEPVLPIREMFTPIRYESNHANMVFLTNELQALQLMPGDRRYMVIRTPAALSLEYYRAVADEARAGGVAALYAYLLDYGCAGFDEHAKPLFTAAKEDLIEIGLSSTQYFQRQLHDGLLWPLVYQPCLSKDLYRAYTTFCARTGERNAARENRFSHEFMQMNGVSRSVRDVGDPDTLIEVAGVPRRQATVFTMGAIPDQLQGDSDAFIAWIKKNVAEFRAGLREYMRQDELRRPSSEKGGGSYGHGYDE